MADTTITLITGPNRGIGRGILAALLKRPNNTVIAAVRDPQATASVSLRSLEKAESSKLLVIKIDASVPTDPSAAIKELEANGITHVDTVIANAAMGTVTASVLDTKTDDIRQHMEVNLIGVVGLFQAFEPLLKKASKPKFIALSSELGSVNLVQNLPGPWLCYGVTKAALNYFLRRVHVENEWLTVVTLQPGWAQTDMGNLAARSVGMEKAPKGLEECVEGCLRVIDKASKEKYDGEFVDYEEKAVLW